MSVPQPRWNVGDRVKTFRGSMETGVILARKFDNLIHHKEWVYKIAWPKGDITNHHLCWDLTEA